ncbi:O-methyltransferase [Melia azedarach]|uniref:O-methyltransferase n=1 Tax=Melia azedarach TaxID=155640 RepID=A0ACC1Z1W7_MELAZ|nr:O-methyltransferase [Melia azedarach]
MESLNLIHDSELLQAQAYVWNHIFNFINFMSLKCAIQLGIPDIIKKHGKSMTLDELVTALPIHPTKTQCVYRLMRILTHSDFFALQNHSQNDREEGYIPTNASQLLLKDNSLSVTPFLLVMLDPILTTPWYYMST